MLKFIAGASLAFVFATTAHAEPTQTVHWPENKKVICGGSVDGESLDFHVTIENEVIGAQSKDERVRLYVDLKKPERVHVLIAEALRDDEYAKREEIANKLPPDEAALIRDNTQTKISELFTGFTDGLVQLDFRTKAHTLSLSCQEQLEDWESGLKLEP